ncbi:hypothetical protein M9H77_01779 [Catharanthus roseus]|uniref:Uncharacterized protein n=1 Tax=Catharanthus roseus TaxID=4058 RepID=A0ACC0C6Q9_CATRO|nr:hypothetical protein M9H77_01779 [Catharanthus roseus]
MPDDLQLMAIAASGISLGYFSQAAAGLVPYCLDHKQRLMQRVEDVVSRVSAIFDEHMMRLFEHNPLVYISFPQMMPFIKALMTIDPSIFLLIAAATGTSEGPGC